MCFVVVVVMKFMVTYIDADNVLVVMVISSLDIVDVFFFWCDDVMIAYTMNKLLKIIIFFF